MNRTGLATAVAVGVIAGLAFGLYPELDLWISAPFYDAGQHVFPITLDWSWRRMRNASMWLVTLIAAPAGIALALKLLLPHRPLLVSGRAIVFLLTSLALGPGLAVNVILKDNSGRARPFDVVQFGGKERFTPWWDMRGPCPNNCSFSAGEPAGAFWTMAPAALAPPAWRPLAYGAALAFGTGVGAMRIAAGRHFASDVVFAGIIAFLIVWLVHALIYRWKATRVSDAAVERAIEAIATPGYDAVARLFARIGAHVRRGRTDKQT